MGVQGRAAGDMGFAHAPRDGRGPHETRFMGCRRGCSPLIGRHFDDKFLANKGIDF